ncbi:MAG: helix-turn-helix domain-containing protein [Fibrobacter sp.]|uniref:helix-turn-helix domain-containing protein n=1 Tax=Fibrobacter sp. TaxID=35828 RepID=UPI002A90F51A|nr:helix-turn-helix domain-containing protein [Fibrobacter sp.]MDY6263383.1 helix-turn-helix domain-containing protein [Fibrobacter sp.]
MSNPAEKSPDEKLGAFIARVREERGMSVEELSAATKVSVAYIKSIEAGDWKAFPVAAYVRGYLHSICNKLNLNQQQVLKAYVAESGAPVDNDFEDVSNDQKLAPLNEGESKKKNLVVPVVLVLLVLAFLVVSHFLDLESLTTKQASEQQPSENVPAAVEDSMTQEIPDGAEAVPADSVVSDSVAKDSSANRFDVNATVSQAVVDEAVKKSDLPASATIFISSDSKKDSVAVEEAPKTKKTNFLLVGSGDALSWVGLKRHEDSNSFLKEANISKAGVKMVYNTNDTLCVTIGEPKAIAKMYLNGVETPLPEMKFGRVTRFRVFGGRIVK